MSLPTSKEELEKLRQEKFDYLEKIKSELNAVAGQIVLLNELINPKPKEETK